MGLVGQIMSLPNMLLWYGAWFTGEDSRNDVPGFGVLFRKDLTPNDDLTARCPFTLIHQRAWLVQ
jgi:hypothetical protein